MRLVYLCPDPGIPIGGTKGASVHVRGLVRAFARLGHEVRVLSPRIENAASVGAPVIEVSRPEVDLAAAVTVDPRVARALRHLWNNVAVENALRELMTEFEPDLVYERYSPFGVAGGAVAKTAGIHHVLEVNAPLAWEGTEYRNQALPEAAEALERAAFDLASVIVTVSAELRELLAAAGVPREKIQVVPNGVDSELFEPPDGGADDVRGSDLADSANALVIGFVGSLKPWHGLNVLADAFDLLAADPRYRVLVVGDGPEAKQVEALARRYPSRVRHVPSAPHDDIPSHLRAMDIVVAPYPQLERFYFSPLKIVESMAAGRPTVASRIGQIPSLIRDGETGLLVPPGDSVALAEVIRTLAEDPGLRGRLGRAAAREVAERHHWTHRASEILEHLRAPSPC